MAGEVALEVFAAKTAGIRRALGAQLTVGMAAASLQEVHCRAAASVWLAAALEVFWTSFLDDLCVEVQSLGVKSRRQRIVSQSVFVFDKVLSIGAKPSQKAWNRLAEIVREMSEMRGAKGSFQRPYDGRTVRPEHFETCWTIFSLRSPAFPSPQHRTALITLADQRNDLAHGKIAPEVFGKLNTATDLITAVGRIEDLVEHCVVSSH